MDLWNNPLVNNALKALSPEQIADYKKIGEQMYGSIDFEDSKILNNMPPPMAEAVAYVEQGVKSGLLPSDLTEDEVVLLSEAYGEKWYERYGYKQEDVPEPGLSLNMKKEIEDVVNDKVAEAIAKSKKKDKKNNK
jgi:hypothetical protein